MNIRPLSNEQIRKLARSYPVLFAAVAGVMETGSQDATSISEILLANAEVVNDIVAEGLGATVEEAKNLGLLKYVLASQIVAATKAAHQLNGPVDFGNLVSLINGNGTVQ